MGFLEEGIPLQWSDTKEYYDLLDKIRKLGVDQNRSNDELKWGDEIEYHLFKRTRNDSSVQLLCIAHELLKKLDAQETSSTDGKEFLQTWHPEWGDWMVEATPGKNLRELEESLRNRRARIQSFLGDDEGLCSLPAWPRMGCKDFVEGSESLKGDIAASQFLPDHIINPHPRFGTLVQNIRLRRGSNVDIRMPLFQDKNTNKNDTDIYMDAMGFGMGACCLQVTFQARDIDESRYLYDQLSVLCPIFLSLSAGTPILKGLIADSDVRWSVISQSVDCRTDFELGRGRAKGKMQRGSQRIYKSRYDSISLYISNDDRLLNEVDFYNDIKVPVDKYTVDKLRENEVDESLARHIGHLFIRDPLVIYSDRIDVDNETSSEHFENIQSTNWQTMRWKPPPINVKDMGWRVEFRPIETQLTDFESAAYIISVVLISRVVLFFDLNFYCPLSKVDENMKRAHKMDSVLKEKFWFREQITPLEAECADGEENNKIPNFSEFTVAELLCGAGDRFPGLFPLVYAYLEIIGCDDETHAIISKYLTFLQDRAEGKIKTLARWMRDFVTSHPEYKGDSKISSKLEHDLVLRAFDISNGKVQDRSLTGNNFIKPVLIEPKAKQEESEMHRLRGSSFSEDIGNLKSKRKLKECAIVKALIAKHRGSLAKHEVKPGIGFQNTPAFLPVKLDKVNK